VVQGPAHRVEQLVVVSDDRVARIASSLEQPHPTLLPADVGVVLTAELEYLRSIGAVGPQAERAE
jgi:hypothetical protein